MIFLRYPHDIPIWFQYFGLVESVESSWPNHQAFLQKLSSGSPRWRSCGPSLVDPLTWGPSEPWTESGHCLSFARVLLYREEGIVPIPNDSFAGGGSWGEGLQLHCVSFRCLPRKSSRARWLQWRTACLLRIRRKNWLGNCFGHCLGQSVQFLW